MKTGIYVRVSTEEQAREGFSIRAQEEKLRSYADIKDWPIYNVYIDEGISGKNIIERPAINRLLKDVEKGSVQNVLVFKVDRLTRSTKDLIELVEFFNQYNCAFNSLMEAIDTTSATGRMFLKIIGIFAEFERENLVERVKVGFERKVKEGYSLCSFTPSYGYSRPKGQKVQTIDDTEAVIVKEIFNDFVEKDYALTKIARLLNQRGVPTKRNSLWTAKTVRLLLANPNYIGKVRYQCGDELKYFEAEGIHDPIIDTGIFYAAQEKLAKYKRLEIKRYPSEEGYFARIAVCEKCGTKLSPSYSRKKSKRTGETMMYKTYRCINAARSLCTFSCTHSAVEKAFEDYLDSIEDLTAQIEDDHQEEQKIDALKKEQKYLRDALDSLENKAKEVMELYVTQHLSFEDYKATLSLVNEKKQDIEIRLNTLTIPKKEVCFSEKDIIRNLKQNWINFSNKERLDFLHRFVNKIVIRSTKRGVKYYDYSVAEVVFNEF